MSQPYTTMPSTKTPWLVYIAACIASIGGIFFGYDLAVISGAILFIQKKFVPSATVEKFVVSSSLMGELIGALFRIGQEEQCVEVWDSVA